MKTIDKLNTNELNIYRVELKALSTLVGGGEPKKKKTVDPEEMELAVEKIEKG